MDDQTKATLLSLLKLDLGISHNLRDTYFNNLLESSQNEIERTGIVLDFTSVDDQMLTVDYAAWTYRKRQEDAPLSRNLKIRINNRLIKKAGTPDTTLVSLLIGSLTLSPSFNKNVTDYTATATNAADTITATSTDELAIIQIMVNGVEVINGSSTTWIIGTNNVIITVTNSLESKVYTVVVTKGA